MLLSQAVPIKYDNISPIFFPCVISRLPFPITNALSSLPPTFTRKTNERCLGIFTDKNVSLIPVKCSVFHYSRPLYIPFFFRLHKVTPATCVFLSTLFRIDQSQQFKLSESCMYLRRPRCSPDRYRSAGGTGLHYRSPVCWSPFYTLRCCAHLLVT
jgi:hypothetical protein